MLISVSEDWDDRDEMQVPGAVHNLVATLATEDGAERRMAREGLIDIGAPAVPALTKELESRSASVRWEAAKALGEIADPRAASALVRALEDTEPTVRWLAARGLIALGREALIPLLEALEERADSMRMREGARRVLHTLVREGTATEAAPVLRVLEDIEAPAAAPGVAYAVLQNLYRAGSPVGES